MTKVLIIGSGDRENAIMLAKRQFGDDVYIIPQEEEKMHQFESNVFTITAPQIVTNPLIIPKSGKEKRRERRAKERKEKP